MNAFENPDPIHIAYRRLQTIGFMLSNLENILMKVSHKFSHYWFSFLTDPCP